MMARVKVVAETEMAYVKAIISERARKHLSTPEDRREFIETYLGVRSSKTLRFESVGSRHLPDGVTSKERKSE